MKKMLLTIVVVISSALCMYAQNLTPIANQKGKMGFQDETGNVVIKQVYDYAEPFDSYGLAKVGKGDEYGLINKKGELILPIEYKVIGDRVAGQPTIVQTKKAYGMINPASGAIIVKPELSFLSKFNCYGLAWFTKGGNIKTFDGKQYVVGGKLGIIDKNGTILLEPKYKAVFEFAHKTNYNTQSVFGESELLTVFSYLTTDSLVTDCRYLGFGSNISKTENAGVIDINGNVLLKEKIYDRIAKPQNGILRYWKTEKKATTYGYYNIAKGEGKDMEKVSQKIDEIKFVTHGDFYGNIAPVNNSTTWYFVDKDYNVISKDYTGMKYSKIKPDGSGYWAGVANDNSAVYTTEGKKLVESVTFSDAELPTEASVDDVNFALKVGEKWGLYDINGSQLIAPNYEYLYSSRHGLYCFKQGDKWGGIDIKGKTLVPANYLNMVFPVEKGSTNVWVMKSDSLYYNYDMVNQKELKAPFTNVSPFKNGMAWASPKDDAFAQNKFGILIDKTNTPLVDKGFPYSYLSKVEEKIKENGGKALTSDQSNKFILKLIRGVERYDIEGIVPATSWDY